MKMTVNQWLLLAAIYRDGRDWVNLRVIQEARGGAKKVSVDSVRELVGMGLVEDRPAPVKSEAMLRYGITESKTRKQYRITKVGSEVVEDSSLTWVRGLAGLVQGASPEDFRAPHHRHREYVDG